MFGGYSSKNLVKSIKNSHHTSKKARKPRIIFGKSTGPCLPGAPRLRD